MRYFGEMIFLGSPHASNDKLNLMRRLSEGLELLGGYQQPPRSNSVEAAEEDQKVRKQTLKEIEDIIEDISMALSGKEYVQKDKYNFDYVEAKIKGNTFYINYDCSLGFGGFTIQVNPENPEEPAIIDSEAMSKSFIKAALNKLVDDAVIRS